MSAENKRGIASCTGVKTYILSQGHIQGGLAPAPPHFAGEKILLIFNAKKIMLNFEHFSKCTPEMYPLGTPFSDF